ncbi:zinc finger in N-recognin (macronuclear) [Tetrahymena thermophila SB210]|uniref:E3 ubiquitin-protein ligase n=1 Tax=Tetrahymena thermophila (strain SB210) TaxID=312017 RepID=I7MDV3_TETTS|nr:zinc finger in N-recognin [Tetrahymena thermophila SB210]EAR91014.2 zinc finger in N-recognin [Tetrahymena thermophila SB210]|eukprot:XP_001011259.2 zinc finger in N-recognin [Tetrahymena thermophila SB210]
MNAKELQMIDELLDNPQRIEACMESNEVMYLCLDCSIKDPKIYVYICQNCLESQTHKKHKIIQTDNGDLSERCSCGDSEMLGVVIECENHNKNTHTIRQKVDKKVSPQILSSFEQYAMANFTRIFKTLEANFGNSNQNSSDAVDPFYEQFLDISIKQPQLCASILMKSLNNFYTRHNCQSPTIDIDSARYQRLCSCSIIENLFRQSEKTSWYLKRILLNCVRHRPFVFQLTKIYSKMLLPLFETENNQLLDLMKEFNPPQVFQVFISQVALVKNIMSLLESILQNLETVNYESYLKKFETLNNLMKFIFKREMQVDESMMKQFCNIISKVCVKRKEIKDYFHEEILIVMEEMNFDFLRLLLNSLHRQADWKQISANLIYEYIVKCECEVDYEFSEERKKNPWFQGSVGILGILLCSTFVEIYEEVVGEEINQSNQQFKKHNNQKNNSGIFITKNSEGRIIGNIEKAKEAMRKYTLTISKHTQNGLEKLFKSICREIMRDLFFIFTQERALRNNPRAQYNEESNEYQMKTVLHCYKNRLYYRELSNLQIFGMLISPEMFMQAAFEAMKWKPQRFDRTFYKYQKQHYPQQFEQSPALSQSPQKSSICTSQVSNCHNSLGYKIQSLNSSNNNLQNSTHKRAVSYQQARNFSSFSCSPSNNSNQDKDSIQRNNRRATNISEAGILKEHFHKEGIEDLLYDFYDDGIDEDDEDLFDLEEKKGTFDESILLKYEFVSEILILCNVDVLNFINNIQPCFKEDKIILNEIRRNICINAFNFQSQISMVNLTIKLESMKLFDTSSLKKIIFNFSELGNNKLLKLKSQFCDKYEPVMWRPYSWLDAEFIEKLKEKKLECILGNMSPLLEKHIFFSDLPASPTFLKFIRNSFHFLYKNPAILSNILKITYDLLILNNIKQNSEQTNIQEKEIPKQKLEKQKVIMDENFSLNGFDSGNKKEKTLEFRLSKEKFFQLRLDSQQIQAIKQFYSQPAQLTGLQSNQTSPARAAGISDHEGLLQSFNIFFDLINKYDFIYCSPKNSSNNIESISTEIQLNSVNNNASTKGGSIDSSNNLQTQISDQQRKQLLLAKQKEIMEQFQNKQKKFQDQNEQILDKSFNTVISSNNNNNNNNSGNKSLSIYSQANNHIQYSPYQDSLLEQQECVICKTDIGITVIHAYVIQDNLNSYFQITEKNLIPSSLSSRFAITSCQHITHQRCHEMGIENIQISKRALSKEDKEAQLETFCTICKSLSNISVVVLDCYFKKITYGSIYHQLFSQSQNPTNKRYLHQTVNPITSFNHNTNHIAMPNSQQIYQKSSSQSNSTQFTQASIQKQNNQFNQNQACKSDFKDSTKKILDSLVHQEIIALDKQIINNIYSALEEFLSLLAIISNNEDNIQEFHIYSVGDCLLQSLLEKILLTQNMENYFEKDFKLLENLFLNLKVIFKGQECEQKRLKQDYLNLTIQKILETDIFEYASDQLSINNSKPHESVSFCMMYISIIFRIALVYGEEQSVQYTRDYLQNIFLIFTLKEIMNSQKSSCDFSLLQQKQQSFYSDQQINLLIKDIKSIWLNEENIESRENIQISCIPFLRMGSIFLQLVCDISNNSNTSFQYPKNNLDPISELEKYEKAFGKYFINLDLEFAEYTLKESSEYSPLKFLKNLYEYSENHQRQINNFYEFDKKIFKLSQIDQNFETFYKQQFWKKCQIDFNFPQIEKSPLIMCLICGLQMADNCQRGNKIVQNDVNHAHIAHKGYCVYIQLQDGLLIYVEKDSVQTSQSLYYDKLGRMANCLNYPEWDEFQLDKGKFQEVEELVINRKLANYVRYILMQTEDDYAYFDEDYPL